MSSKINGCYEGFIHKSLQANEIQLKLRVDVGGKRSLNVMSGDIYCKSGKTRNYLSSFIFQDIRKFKRKDEIVLVGESGNFDPQSETFTRFRVRILLRSSPFIAEVSWADSSGIESRCLCKHRSEYFRSVQLQNDCEEGVVPFNFYDASILPYPAQNHPCLITLADAYAEAGIEITSSMKAKKPVPHPKQTNERGSVWTDKALQEVMAKRFDNLGKQLQWKIWLLSAFEYEIPDVKGIMLFDAEQKKSGCAVFHRAIGEESNEEKRMMLFVYVHELGHCFNLQHPWIKTEKKYLGSSEGYSSLSWMTCPQRYYSSLSAYGEAAFWKNFQFRFSDSELIHLRHGFRNDVMFGCCKSEKDETD